MTCQQVVNDFLNDYVDGNLTLRERFRLRLHLAHCAHCRRYLDGYRQTVAAAKAAHVSEPAAPSDVPEELVKAILDARQPRD